MRHISGQWNYMGAVSRLLVASPGQRLMETSSHQSFTITQLLSIYDTVYCNHCITIIHQEHIIILD